MKKFTRREFLGTGAMGMLALRAKTIHPFAAKLDVPLAFQYWVLREPLGTDLDGTLKKMRAIGYDAIELCSPASYSRFVTFETTDPVDIRRRIEDAGLRCESSHFTGDEVLGDVHSAIELAQTLGLKTMYISSANFDEREATLDQWKQFAEEANAAGEIVKDAGLQLGYHNHMIGPVIDGKPQYDHLMELLDGDLVKMQFQIAAIREGYDVVEYLRKYAGRYTSLHLSDYDPEQERGVPVGSGAVDWPKLIEAARLSEIDELGYIVEVGSEDPYEGVTESYAYLSQLSL